MIVDLELPKNLTPAEAEILWRQMCTEMDMLVAMLERAEMDKLNIPLDS